MTPVFFPLFALIFAMAGGDPRYPMDCALRTSLWVRLTQARQAWASFRASDPAKHDPFNFQYFVHAFKGYVDAPPDQWMSNYRYSDIPGGPLDRLLFERFSMSSSLSGSLINQDKRGLFGPSAIILRADPSNLFAARSGDLGYVQSARDPEAALLNAFQINGLPPPSDLIQKSHPEAYNEVVFGFERAPTDLKGQAYQTWVTAQIKSRVGGIVHSAAIHGGEYAEYRAVVDEFAARMGVPVIWLPEGTP